MLPGSVENRGHEEGRPTQRVVQPSCSPKKEATEFGLSTTLTTEVRASSDSGQTTTSTLQNYQLYNTILTHNKIIAKTTHSQARALHL